MPSSILTSPVLRLSLALHLQKPPTGIILVRAPARLPVLTASLKGKSLKSIYTEESGLPVCLASYDAPVSASHKICSLEH
ncbi:hypothetical protein EV421DRAFT_1907107 [Armillaria borealis]|uniref:Uncharacterized protein n=1 Tax=Armillaria borealis TaxID=47425 RepID=A0AA39J7K4_9AGAR|nr:hypothetical protein EV421DRAFT_1907107 [Armillaria borealis]